MAIHAEEIARMSIHADPSDYGYSVYSGVWDAAGHGGGHYWWRYGDREPSTGAGAYTGGDGNGYYPWACGIAAHGAPGLGCGLPCGNL